LETTVTPIEIDWCSVGGQETYSALINPETAEESLITRRHTQRVPNHSAWLCLIQGRRVFIDEIQHARPKRLLLEEQKTQVIQVQVWVRPE
jgi:hypothetical protein